jgi:hypothetical protein
MAEVTVSTAVPSVTFSATGIAVPDEIDILNGRLTDLDTAMGGGMSKSLTTPQGQIAMSDTAIIGDKNDNLAWLVNQINPDFAEGRMQDAIGQIYFIDRIAAIGTTVTATATGLVGTVIPANSIAQDSSGYLYYSLADAVIPASGAIDIVLQNQASGPIACPIGALSTIYRAILAGLASPMPPPGCSVMRWRVVPTLNIAASSRWQATPIISWVLFMRTSSRCLV